MISAVNSIFSKNMVSYYTVYNIYTDERYVIQGSYG